MAEKIILTGDRPTGKLHVGHYVGSLKRRVELQNSGTFDKIFIMIADAQALTDNADNPAKVRDNIMEVALRGEHSGRILQLSDQPGGGHHGISCDDGSGRRGSDADA